MKLTLPKVMFVLLILFSSMITVMFFLKDHTLYWDNPAGFLLYQEHFHSINKFGNIAWWFPHIQDGWPTEWYSVLGYPGISPALCAFTLPIWILGRFGIFFEEYFYLFVIHCYHANPTMLGCPTVVTSSCVYRYSILFVIFFIIVMVCGIDFKGCAKEKQ